MDKNTMFKRSGVLMLGLLIFSLLFATGHVDAQTNSKPSRESQAQSSTETTLEVQSQENQNEQTIQTDQTIYEYIQAEPELESVELLIEAVGLADNLQQDGPFTVFAPTNEALAAFNAKADIDTDMLPELALYHVVNGEYTSSDLASYWALPTLAGEHLFFETSTTQTGVTSEGEAVQTTHVTLNGEVEVVRSDILTANGVIHIIDAVLPMPEGNTLYASELGDPTMSMADVLAADGRFDTFLSLAEQAGLTDMLETTTATHTLFVPTDEAFEQVPEEMLESWLADPDALNLILSYHMVNDRLSINQIANGHYLPTLAENAHALVITTDEDVQVYVNGRPVQEFNILANNGLIHVVDEVVLP